MISIEQRRYCKGGQSFGEAMEMEGLAWFKKACISSAFGGWPLRNNHHLVWCNL
jgi:hypothetical protein